MHALLNFLSIFYYLPNPGILIGSHAPMQDAERAKLAAKKAAKAGGGGLGIPKSK